MGVKSKETVYDGYFKVNKMTVENSDGTEVPREQFELDNAVAALVYDTKKEVFIFVKQFRVGPESSLLEIPAGKMDVEGESPAETIEREIEEEIGYKVDAIQELYSYYPAPGSSTEKINLFFCEVSEKISEGGGVETEDIEIVEISNEELPMLLQDGRIEDGKSIIAIQSVVIDYLIEQQAEQIV